MQIRPCLSSSGSLDALLDQSSILDPPNRGARKAFAVTPAETCSESKLWLLQGFFNISLATMICKNWSLWCDKNLLSYSFLHGVYAAAFKFSWSRPLCLQVLDGATVFPKRLLWFCCPLWYTNLGDGVHDQDANHVPFITPTVHRVLGLHNVYILSSFWNCSNFLGLAELHLLKISCRFAGNNDLETTLWSGILRILYPNVTGLIRSIILVFQGNCYRVYDKHVVIPP